MLSICCPSCACEAFLLGLFWAEGSWISLNVNLPPSDQGSKSILSGGKHSIWPQRCTSYLLWLYLVYLRSHPRCKSVSNNVQRTQEHHFIYLNPLCAGNAIGEIMRSYYSLFFWWEGGNTQLGLSR